jgi:predicted MPP superfamily phosphohydrolase
MTLPLAGWPADTPPISVALLSDIHLGNLAMDGVRLSAIVDQVNAARPDLVLIAGDFTVGHDAVGAAERAAGLESPLSRLNARLGVVAVLGNHDHWTRPRCDPCGALRGQGQPCWRTKPRGAVPSPSLVSMTPSRGTTTSRRQLHHGSEQANSRRPDAHPRPGS